MVIRSPEVAVATGDSRRRGSNRIPAPMADVELTVCSLCGMLMIAAMNGNPVRKPLLFKHGQRTRQETKKAVLT